MTEEEMLLFLEEIRPTFDQIAMDVQGWFDEFAPVLHEAIEGVLGWWEPQREAALAAYERMSKRARKSIDVLEELRRLERAQAAQDVTQ